MFFEFGSGWAASLIGSIVTFNRTVVQSAASYLPFTIRKAFYRSNCPSVLYETQGMRNHGCPSPKAIGPGFRDTRQLKLNGRKMTSAISGGTSFSASSKTSLTATPRDVDRARLKMITVSHP